MKLAALIAFLLVSFTEVEGASYVLNYAGANCTKLIFIRPFSYNEITPFDGPGPTPCKLVQGSTMQNLFYSVSFQFINSTKSLDELSNVWFNNSNYYKTFGDYPEQTIDYQTFTTVCPNVSSYSVLADECYKIGNSYSQIITNGVSYFFNTSDCKLPGLNSPMFYSFPLPCPLYVNRTLVKPLEMTNLYTITYSDSACAQPVEVLAQGSYPVDSISTVGVSTCVNSDTPNSYSGGAPWYSRIVYDNTTKTDKFTSKLLNMPTKYIKLMIYPDRPTSFVAIQLNTCINQELVFVTETSVLKYQTNNCTGNYTTTAINNYFNNNRLSGYSGSVQSVGSGYLVQTMNPAYDCVGKWSEWSLCSTTTNTRNRTFTVTKPLENGGTSCPNLNGDIETDATQCPVAGVTYLLYTTTTTRTGKATSMQFVVPLIMIGLSFVTGFML